LFIIPKYDIFINDSLTTDFIFNDIEYYKKDIESWARINYFNPDIIIKFIKNLASFYLSKINKYNNDDVIIWSKNFSSNFNKCLTDNTIEEKI
jgi:hypothetical protein